MTRSSATRSARLLVNGRLTPRSKCSLEKPRARGLLQGALPVATVTTNTIWTRMASPRTLGAVKTRWIVLLCTRMCTSCNVGRGAAGYWRPKPCARDCRRNVPSGGFSEEGAASVQQARRSKRGAGARAGEAHVRTLRHTRARASMSMGGMGAPMGMGGMGSAPTITVRCR